MLFVYVKFHLISPILSFQFCNMKGSLSLIEHKVILSDTLFCCGSSEYHTATNLQNKIVRNI